MCNLHTPLFAEIKFEIANCLPFDALLCNVASFPSDGTMIAKEIP